MRQHRAAGARRRQATVIVPLLCLAACSSLPPPPTHEEVVRDGLTDLVAIKDPACGRVLDYSLDDKLDYRVVCESGLVYRIRVTAAGHVAATPHAVATPLRP